MKFNSRLSASVHALLKLAEHDESQSAETLGAALQTNPNVVRQNMLGLREAGLVRSDSGHDGWKLARDVASINLRDVYVALGEPALFVLRNRSEDAACIVETTVDAALAAAFRDAQARLAERLAEISLGDLMVDAGKHE